MAANETASWARRYVGIEFREHGRASYGVDCYGLVCLIYLYEFGVELESFSECYADTKDAANIAKQMLLSSVGAPWRHLEENEEAKAGDVALLAIGGILCHCGVMVSPSDMVHCLKDTNSAIEKTHSKMWAKRLAGIYRHESQE